MEQTKFNTFFRKIINKQNRKKLKNTDFTLIVNNCNGTFLYHDLGLKFNSPFINLALKPEDFIRYLKNINHYINTPLTFIKNETKKYPLGLLDDVIIHFVHYETEEIAKQKWIERSNRINFNNIFIIFTVSDGIDKKILSDFEALPFKNKIIFTNSSNIQSKSVFYIKNFKGDSEAPHGYYKFINKFSGKRFYDQFNYIKWFNSELLK